MSRSALPTRVYLVRHGETSWNARGVFQGTIDIGLNPCGEAQARALAERLRGVVFEGAYTSDLWRARRTTDLVLNGRSIAPTVVPSLRELCYGAWQGITRERWIARDSGLVERWDTAPWTVTFPGGESLDDVLLRTAPVWRRLVDAHRGQCVLVSGHGHVNRVLLTYALGLPRERFWDITQPNGGCCVLDESGTGQPATLLAAA